MTLLQMKPDEDTSIPRYLATLNPAQRAAVEATDGAVLVLAGAGTGKTRVLTTRIAHLLIQRKAFSGQILAVTFTNKAAREMVERVQHLLHSGITDDQVNPRDTTQGMWLGTFHAIAARILRRHPEPLGLTSSFTILDTDDQIRLIKTLLGEQNIDDKQNPAKSVLAIIQGWKDRGLTPDKVPEDARAHPASRNAHRVYVAYQKRLREVNAVDFGDLLLHNLTLFAHHPEILQEYSQRFRYILVDEYQDTNVCQYLWLRLLALAHGNLCCVGDDDQSIYGWRGAEVGNILRFEKDYPGAAIIKLEQNYRSTKPILAAAASLISHNKGRLGKTLWTADEGGEPIRVCSIWDDMEEARFVGEEVEARQRDKIPLSEMAVLVRAGFQTRGFEERFLTLGVPYRVVGGLRFYERMEIRDAIAYLRLCVQPRDDLAFERIINTPKRGIGKATLEQLHLHARGHNISLMEAARILTAEGQIKGKAASTLDKFCEDMAQAGRLAGEMKPTELAAKLLEESGYIAMWQQDKSPDAQGRIENIQELLRALGEFTSITEFLEHVGLVTDTTDAAQDDMVSIMTLHAAKGLEFDTVFLTGWEEGLFPHQRALDEAGGSGLEEERRLAYVGLTRAKRILYITHAANRRIYNQWQSSIPSRFLAELPQEHLEARGSGPASGRARSPQLFQHEMERILMEANRAAPSPAPSANTTPSLLGKRVFHQKFGYGKVVGENGNHLDISFDKAGRKKLLADYVQVQS